VGGLYLEYLLVRLLGLRSVSLLIVNDSQVEHGSGVTLLCECYSEIFNRVFIVFLLLIVEDPDVEVGLEVLGVSLVSIIRKRNTERARM